MPKPSLGNGNWEQTLFGVRKVSIQAPVSKFYSPKNMVFSVPSNFCSKIITTHQRLDIKLRDQHLVISDPSQNRYTLHMVGLGEEVESPDGIHAVSLALLCLQDVLHVACLCVNVLLLD
jgi:hypothetical protein